MSDNFALLTEESICEVQQTNASATTVSLLPQTSRFLTRSSWKRSKLIQISAVVQLTAGLVMFLSGSGCFVHQSFVAKTHDNWAHKCSYGTGLWVGLLCIASGLVGVLIPLQKSSSHLAIISLTMSTVGSAVSGINLILSGLTVYIIPLYIRYGYQISANDIYHLKATLSFHAFALIGAMLGVTAGIVTSIGMCGNLCSCCGAVREPDKQKPKNGDRWKWSMFSQILAYILIGAGGLLVTTNIICFVVAASSNQHYSYLCTFGTGLWVGPICITTGIIGLIAILRPSLRFPLGIAFLVLTIIASVVSVVSIIISSVSIHSAEMERLHIRYMSSRGYDEFGVDEPTFWNENLAINIVGLIAAIVSFIVGIVAAAITCGNLCSCIRRSGTDAFTAVYISTQPESTDQRVIFEVGSASYPPPYSVQSGFVYPVAHNNNTN